MQNKNKELDRLNGVYMKLLNNAGVKYIEGRGTLVDAHTVEVEGKQYTVSCRTSHAKRFEQVRRRRPAVLSSFSSRIGAPICRQFPTCKSSQTNIPCLSSLTAAIACRQIWGRQHVAVTLCLVFAVFECDNEWL